jgi:transposase-like protein
VKRGLLYAPALRNKLEWPPFRQNTEHSRGGLGICLCRWTRLASKSSLAVSAAAVTLAIRRSGWLRVRRTASHREPSMTVSAVAPMHGVSPSLLFGWRRRMSEVARQRSKRMARWSPPAACASRRAASVTGNGVNPAAGLRYIPTPPPAIRPSNAPVWRLSGGCQWVGQAPGAMPTGPTCLTRTSETHLAQDEDIERMDVRQAAAVLPFQYRTPDLSAGSNPLCQLIAASGGRRPRKHAGSGLSHLAYVDEPSASFMAVLWLCRVLFSADPGSANGKGVAMNKRHLRPIRPPRQFFTDGRGSRLPSRRWQRAPRNGSWSLNISLNAVHNAA